MAFLLLRDMRYALKCCTMTWINTRFHVRTTFQWNCSGMIFDNILFGYLKFGNMKIWAWFVVNSCTWGIAHAFFGHLLLDTFRFQPKQWRRSYIQSQIRNLHTLEAFFPKLVKTNFIWRKYPITDIVSCLVVKIVTSDEFGHFDWCYLSKGHFEGFHQIGRFSPFWSEIEISNISRSVDWHQNQKERKSADFHKST